MESIISAVITVIIFYVLYTKIKPTNNKMSQQDKRYAVSNRAGEIPESASAADKYVSNKPVQTVVKAGGTETHKHIVEVPQGYVNINGKIVKREDLEKYQ